MHYHLFWVNLALYLELNLLAVLAIVYALYHQYHAFTSTANDDEIELAR